MSDTRAPDDFWTDETLVVLLTRIANRQGALSNADREAIRQAAVRLNALRGAPEGNGPGDAG